MKSVIVAAVLAMSSIVALSRPVPVAEIQYVGGISICSRDAGKLAEWYQRFGIGMTHMPDQGGWFGGFQWNEVDFHFGLYQRGFFEEWCSDSFEPTPTAAFSYRVSDFDGYLEKLKLQNIEPFEIMTAPEGRFAIFTDPEGNALSIWGI
jgi:predicted enzyme related to lactoylglutathione lyase